mmetsp:Transcript_33014/g.82015  ORF Transcript_33014/g.82015 Transcript_33014/m.82015 type:complete len:357 (+) Transcript_33014:3-1073(+)
MASPLGWRGPRFLLLLVGHRATHPLRGARLRRRLLRRGRGEEPGCLGQGRLRRSRRLLARLRLVLRLALKLRELSADGRRRVVLRVVSGGLAELVPRRLGADEDGGRLARRVERIGLRHAQRAHAAQLGGDGGAGRGLDESRHVEVALALLLLRVLLRRARGEQAHRRQLARRVEEAEAAEEARHARIDRGSRTRRQLLRELTRPLGERPLARAAIPAVDGEAYRRGGRGGLGGGGLVWALAAQLRGGLGRLGLRGGGGVGRRELGCLGRALRARRAGVRLGIRVDVDDAGGRVPEALGQLVEGALAVRAARRGGGESRLLRQCEFLAHRHSVLLRRGQLAARGGGLLAAGDGVRL